VLSRPVRLLVAAVVLELVLGLLTAAHGSDAAGPDAASVQPRPRPALRLIGHRPVAMDRGTAVRQLLTVRARAVQQHDTRAFLATVDPTATAFRQRQASLVAALRAVPLASWSYDLDGAHTRGAHPALDRRYGTWWAPDVVLHYRLAGFDAAPTEQRQFLTFVQRGGRWYVAADDDFAKENRRTARDLWDGGPVVVTRGTSCLVLAHPGNATLVGTLVRETDAAVPRVTAIWGAGWAQQVVVLVPDTQDELARVVPDAGNLSQIAAVATAELTDANRGYHPVGDRVLVNPATFGRLGPLGRRVVLTHEVTHVASRRATGPQVPTWLVEGLADYVGYRDVDVPLAVSARELQADVRAGRLPAALPADTEFNGSSSELTQTYEQSWLAVVLLARTYGQDGLLRLYREAGLGSTPGSFDRALASQLHTSTAAFTAAWVADLRRELG